MLTAILRDGRRLEIARSQEPGNAAYLVQREGPYRYLSEVSELSFDTFGRDDMPGLIDELLDVRARRSEPSELEHIDAVIELARRAQGIEGATLTFAPA
jgi:hypothetical protein